MHTCRNCGEYVSRDFVRVFGDNHNDIFACPACRHMSDIIHGVGGGVERAQSSY
ncbi:MAG: DUF7563 family protein [Halobacteriota archaeon]